MFLFFILSDKMTEAELRKKKARIVELKKETKELEEEIRKLEVDFWCFIVRAFRHFNVAYFSQWSDAKFLSDKLTANGIENDVMRETKVADIIPYIDVVKPNDDGIIAHVFSYGNIRFEMKFVIFMENQRDTIAAMLGSNNFPLFCITPNGHEIGLFDNEDYKRITQSAIRVACVAGTLQASYLEYTNKYKVAVVNGQYRLIPYCQLNESIYYLKPPPNGNARRPINWPDHMESLLWPNQ